MSFIGNVPAEAYSPVAKDTFSGDDSTTDFTLSIPATTNGVEVLVENVQQEPTTAYTISGTTLSFTAAPVTGTNNIYVIHRGPAVQQIVPPAGVALNPSTVTATGDISTEGDLKVGVTSGGIYTITGTDTATNRTLTLPDEAGTIATTNGITVADIWRLTAGKTSNGDITANLERADDASSGYIGSGMSESSGIFTFPSTGIYQVINIIYVDVQPSDSVSLNTNVSIDGGSTYDTVAFSAAGLDGSNVRANQAACFALVDVTDVSNVKVKFTANSVGSGSEIAGSTNINQTHFVFIRLGDT